MRSAMRFIGMAVYGISVSYSLWLILCFLLPRLVALGWMLVGTYWLVGVLLLGFCSGIGAFLALPLCRASCCVYDCVVPLVAFLISGCSAVMLSWKFLGSFTILSILSVFTLDSYLLALYGTFAVALIKKHNNSGSIKEK